MANQQKGEVSFQAAGKSYIFKFGTSAQAALEDQVKMPWPKFFSRNSEAFGISDLLNVFYAGLYRQHHLTIDEVADLIDELGQDKVGEIVAEGLKLVFGEVAKDSKGPLPLKKISGIGTK